jgi:F-type H+-transporting ATPase subunit gamma
MEELERAQSRLDNIRSVQPIISGLRTISLGSWRAALTRKDNVHRYVEWLEWMLPAVLSHLKAPRRFPRRSRLLTSWMAWLPLIGKDGEECEESPESVAALVIGSERGLCGQFNVSIAHYIEQYLSEQAEREVKVMALGSRLQRVLRRRGQSLEWSDRLSVTSLPPYEWAVDWTQQWLGDYEDEALDAVDVIYNAYRGTGHYEPTVTRLIPPPGPGLDSAHSDGPWPPPIVETDPLQLYITIVEQRTAVNLYDILLDSAASEHSTRYQLLESATQNIDQMTEDLTLTIQSARQHEITQEMQELAVGAGLLEEE